MGRGRGKQRPYEWGKGRGKQRPCYAREIIL